jgi:hypothetical protein
MCIERIIIISLMINCSHIHIHTYIQGVQGEKVNILRGHSMGHSKQKVYSTCVLFRTASEIELFHCTVPILLIRKRYYVLFPIPVFIVQVTKLVQFTTVNINALCYSCEFMECCSSVQWNIFISETVRCRTHVHIHFFAYSDRYYDLPEYWPFLPWHYIYENIFILSYFGYAPLAHFNWNYVESIL